MKAEFGSSPLLPLDRLPILLVISLPVYEKVFPESVCHSSQTHLYENMTCIHAYIHTVGLDAAGQRSVKLSIGEGGA